MYFGFLLLVLCLEVNIYVVVLLLYCRGGVKLVYVCEWNFNVIGVFCYNLLVNGVENCCVVFEGDN